MARKPLRSQLNQIRAWVRQGRTDAWIAHQLDVSASELREFRRRHELAPDAEGEDDLDLRDEIEAEIEAAAREEELAAEEAAAREEEVAATEAEAAPAATEKAGDADGPEAGPADEEEERPRRRRRRGGRGRRRSAASLEAAFEHGGDQGYGLWIDPAVADDPVYSENWAGHRRVEVTVEPDQIVVKRS